MLHPNKGEGEHRSIIKKGPQLFTAALLIALPICMAQSVTDAYANGRTSLLPTQTQAGRGLKPLANSFLGQNLQTKWPSETPSLADINTLESNLSSAKSQLATLKALVPKDPANAQAINTQIDIAQAKVDSYTSKLIAAKTAYSQYQEAAQTLATALAKYNTALDLETALTTKKTLTQTEYDALQLILTNKTATLAAANSNLATAQQAKEDAQATLTTATNNLSTATNDHTTAVELLSIAKDNYDLAVIAYNTASNLKSNLQQELSNAELILSTSHQSKEVKHNDLVTAETNLAEATTNLDLALATKNSTQLTFSQATSNYDSSVDALDNTNSQLESTQTSYEATLAPLEAAWSAFYQANSELGTKTSNLSTKETALYQAQANYNQVITNYNQYLAEYDVAYTNYLDKQSAFNQAQSTLQSAQNSLSQAQWSYDNELISDPLWTPTTWEVAYIRQVAHTETVARNVTTLTGGLTADVFNRQGYNNAPPLPTDTEQPFYTTIVPNINFQWGGGQVLGSGRSEDVIVRFTGTISFPTSDDYQFYSPADDGTKLFIDGVQIISDWRDKGGGGSTSAPVYFEAGSTHSITLYYYENGGGAAVWLYYYTPQTGYQLVPAANLGTTATTTTTYEEVTTYTEETYYVTEVIPNQVAPLINDLSLLPALQDAQATYDAALAAYNTANSNWTSAQAFQQAAAEQSTAGYYAVIDTATIINAAYPEAQQAQFEYYTALTNRDSIWETVGTLNNQKTQASNLILSLTSQQEQQTQTVVTLLAAKESAATNLNSAIDVHNSSTSTYNLAVDDVAVAQSNYDLALTNHKTASANVDTATTNYEVATNNLVTATSDKSNTLAAKTSAQAAKNSAASDLGTATSTKTFAETTLLAATDILTTSQQSVDVASSEVTASQAEVTTKESELTTITASVTSAQQITAANLLTKRVADATVSESLTSYSSSMLEVQSTELPTSTDFNDIETIANQKPPIEEGSKEIPAELTAENLLEINLEEVDPTELTEAQAEQLVEAALETFETAEEGSPEYEQALDALYLAAEQDDIELSPELAAVPGLAAAAELINFFGNAGADMSPAKREESKKIVVTAVVAAGVSVQAAAGAATSAAASSSSAGSSSGSTRRKQ